MRLKIVSKPQDFFGPALTEVRNAETGEKLEGVHSVRFEYYAGLLPLVVVELIDPAAEIDGDSEPIRTSY